MKLRREALNKILQDCILKYADTPTDNKRLVMYLYVQYKMPLFRANTIMSFNLALDEIKDIEVFWIMSALNHLFTANIDLTLYFTEIEIENYSVMKWRNEAESNFPLTIKCLPVSDRQWIGTVEARDIVKWRNSFLRYNKNIQRRLRTVVRGGKTYEEITLKEGSVKRIKELLLQRKFVPNTITLNMGDDCEYYYDDAQTSLVITSADHLDLTDGYHRLVALSKVLEENPDYDLTMELRITAFSESLANHFIWQEEQRNVMPKNVIQSYNLDDIGNRIVKKVNEDPTCNLCGNITRGGLCDFSTFADMLSYCLLREMPQEEKKRALITVSKDMVMSINTITENDPDMISRKFTAKDIRILVYTCCKYYNKAKESLYDIYKKLLIYNYGKEDATIKASGSTCKRVCRLLDSVWKEVSKDDVQ